MSSTHQEYHPVNDASPSYGNRKAGEAAALRHHVTKHYGLKQHEVAAVKHAWPEGVTRFHGMHPDMVRHEVGRALEAHPPETVEKSKKPKNPKLLAENAKIKENAAKPENQVAHNFKGAEWTTGNGHPRCLRCGDEEPISGKCSPRA